MAVTYSAVHSGPGRGLVAVYGIFALAASARAGVQIIRDFQEAPLAYALSGVAALVYILATVFLVVGNRTTHRLAIVSCLFELAGVIVVGVLSLTHPEIFAAPSVWSQFGSGYAFIPLVLPVVGLLWLWRVEKAVRGSASTPRADSSRR